MKGRIKIIYFTTCVCALICLSWNIWITVAMQSKSQKHRRQYFDDGLFKMQNKKLRNITVSNRETEMKSTKLRVQSISRRSSQLETFTAFPPTLVNETDINPAINKFFTLRKKENRDKFINLHQYHFSINSKICIGRKFFIFTVVHSAPKNIEKRTNIRSTYGSVHSYKGRQLGVVFLLGSVDNPQVQESLNNESKTFGDIVQGNFHDSYRNLSRKHIMGMHWYLHHCKSEFILKVDDDTFVNPFRLIETMKNVKTNKLVLHCYVIPPEGPIRNNQSKWYTPKEQYPFPVFPPFCVGFAYVTTPRTWEALYRASGDRRMIEMEDVFVSAILSLKANVGKVALKNVLKCTIKLKLEGLIESSDFIIDRGSRCGDKPFKTWKYILSRICEVPYLCALYTYKF